ncbi:MAG: LytR/AlgR family response regulator transcription factor [Chloroflexota bacterium]
MRVLIVDDEPPARAEMRYMLEKIGEVGPVDDAETAIDALARLQEEHYDLVLLDIRMPGLSGLDAVKVINRVRPRPHVVFVTAYEEHAVQAFEVEADDYLLKPVSERRLRRALERVHGAQPSAAETVSQPAMDRLAVETEDRTLLLKVSDIRFASARGDYTHVRTYDHEYQVRSSLTELTSRLEPNGFLRVHRSFLVNLNHVLELQPYFSGTHVLIMADQHRSEVPVSRSGIKTLRARLGI